MLLLVQYMAESSVCECVFGGDIHTEPLKPGSITNAGPQKAIILTN